MTVLEISVVGTTSEFIESKASKLSSKFDYLQTRKTSLRALFNESTEDIKVSVARELDIVRERIPPIEDELVTLKRQKIKQEDIDEYTSTIKDALSLILNSATPRAFVFL